MFPFSNGGDYLIIDRTKKLIKEAYPSVEFDEYIGNDAVSEEVIDRINTADVIVTGGGGAQFSEQYVKNSFLYKNIEKIKVPIHFTGTGLYAPDGDWDTLSSIKYSDEVISYFKKILEHGGQLAARDWSVASVMRTNHISGVHMTGCPAWYDIGTLVEKKNAKSMADINTVAFSNHGVTKSSNNHAMQVSQMKELVEVVRGRFNPQKILLTFNDGYNTKFSYNYNLMLREWAESQGIDCVDLSCDASKFSVLNNVDFHIGFRVHTHTYCVSKGIPSLLIEEDVRGYGFNEALGLPHFSAYEKYVNNESLNANINLCTQVDMMLEQICNENRIVYDEVLNTINRFYRTNMNKWLDRLAL